MSATEIESEDSFDRLAMVSWEAQIDRHGDGATGYGPQYAYNDPYFRTTGPNYQTLRKQRDARRAKFGN